MEPHAPAFKEASDANAPLFEPGIVVVEQSEVIDIAHIARRSQHFLDEVIEWIEIDVVEQLAC